MSKIQAKTRAFPKLFNAKRQIEVSKGLLQPQIEFYKKNPLSETWRTQVSKDVTDFVDKVERDDSGRLVNELLPQEKLQLFRNPVKYFSRPHNVPNSVREQIYFPQFTVTLLRTPHLGPRYAQFKVPLWFGKLDLKSYLKNVYNVDVNHVRSYVIHRNVTRKQASSRFSRGARVQPAFGKKMTAELVEPFVWPAELSERELDSQEYDRKKYWDSARHGADAGREEQAEFKSKPDQSHRLTIAEQAKALLAGKVAWQPTWQQIPQDVRVLQGRSGTSLSRSNPDSRSPLR